MKLTEFSRSILTTLARFEIEAADRIRALEKERTPEAADFALRRERAMQETLRQALLLRNREVARKPLCNVARHLGIEIPDDSDDWMQLAYEATRVLLNASEERERRELGLYKSPSPFFEQAVGTEMAFGQSQASGIYGTMPSSAVGAPAFASSAIMRGDAGGWLAKAGSLETAVEPLQTTENLPDYAPEVLHETHVARQIPPSVNTQAEESEPLIEKDLLAIVSRRVVLKRCKPETIAALKKGGKITVEEGFNVNRRVKVGQIAA